MKLVMHIAAAVLLACAVSGSESGPLPDGDALMEQVRRALPEEPMRIDAELRTQNHRGEIIRVLNARIDLHWGADIPEAEYHIRDRFGVQRERFRISWPSGEDPEYEYAKGDPLQHAPVPGLFERIEGTEISWADLTLSFLWWQGAETVGTDQRRGRFCYVVDVSPADLTEDTYSRVRMWVDPETSLLLQADAFDVEGNAMRRLQVKSLRRINDVWMVQDLDVHRLPSRNKTTLRVRDLTVQNSR